MTPWRIQVGSATFAIWCAAALLAQPAPNNGAAEDVRRMVREGMVAALESRFSGVRDAEQLRLLAVAQVNKAARVRDDAARQAAFADAERRHLAWIDAIEREASGARIERAVGVAKARRALAGMILSKWAAADLDRFELTGGREGDARRLHDLLVKARNLYEEVRRALLPLMKELDAGGARTEEKYLALGVYDALPSVLHDVDFNLAWTNLYLAIVSPEDGELRKVGLRAAERSFQELIELGQERETATRCRLGLAMALREQGRCDEAEREFDAALRDTGEGALAAQVRYERARSEIRAGRFDDARRTLRPLVEKDPDRLDAADQPARFYINLAHLWDANSYLEQAARVTAAAIGAQREALQQKAARLRQTGLRKMSELAARGGNWPALTQLYVADAIDEHADPSSRGPAELLFSARRLAGDKQYEQAIALLREAAGRDDTPPELAGEILFELGVCQYRNKTTREAAATFERLVREHKSHAKAPRAVTYAYQLWAAVADDSKRPSDYRRFANVALVLLQSFPRHEKRAEAAWWLPVALQSAGDYQAALEHFDAVPPNSPHFEEARFRRAICQRLRFEQQRGNWSVTKLRSRAGDAADELKAYARAALRRADQADDGRRRRSWAATALVNAAEIEVSPGVDQNRRALETLAGFERRFSGSAQIGRALAARINAYRGLEQFADAARVVEQFLRTVSPEQAGGTLAVVARGMQEEVERLERAGDADAARELAVSAIPIFKQLDQWVSADSGRAKYADAVCYGVARMQLLAGQYESAGVLARKLLAKDSRNGDYRRLNALALSASVAENPSADRVAAARDAWGSLLRDASLRTSAPERYWEARYHYLSLLLREGRAREVENAIRQERVWRPELGGAHWAKKLGELQEAARRRMSHSDEARREDVSQPAAP